MMLGGPSERSHTAMKCIALGGSVIARLARGGHVWMFLNYILGFRRLGGRVIFVDRELGDVDSKRGDAEALTQIMKDFGATESSVVIVPSAGRVWRDSVSEDAQTLLIDVMGFVEHPEASRAAQTVFLDIDPGFGQMWCELGLADVFAGHDAFVTIGENIGKPFCEIPTCGLDWLTTRPPVVLDEWPPTPPARPVFTTVASWRGSYGPIDYRGKRYGLRVHEFRKFLELPRITGREFELALDIHPDETRDLDALDRSGWRLVDPQDVASDPWSYRKYIQGSMAEFAVAKSMYVETRSGWFSDRSVCYLASGKPVLVQDTGIRDIYPTGEGLLVYTTLDEAAAGVEEICSHYERHSRAARAIAEEYFDSDKVLTRLLEKLGVA